MAQVQDEIDRELGEVPATLSEEGENLVQIQQIADRTVEPGLMRLPVGTVSMAHNSEKFAIDVHHPILGELRFFVDKPVYGWDDDAELAQLLDWYDIHTRDPYELQVCDVYVEYVGEEADQPHGWELVCPPKKRPKPSLVERVFERTHLVRPKQSVVNVWVTLLFAVMIGSFIGGVLTAGGLMAATMSLGFSTVFFAAGTLIAAGVFEP